MARTNQVSAPTVTSPALAAALREMDSLIGTARTVVGRPNVSFHEAREIFRSRGDATAADRLLALLRSVTELNAPRS